jgi:hypothetical protein
VKPSEKPRRIFCLSNGVLDTATGELSSEIPLSVLLATGEDGVIAGFNLYPRICSLALGIYGDEGWTAYVHRQGERIRDTHVRGIIYYSRLTYRFPKVGGRHERKRPRTKKWRILNLELFCEYTQDREEIEHATDSLIELARLRNVTLPYSPGSFGGKMLRGSPLWTRDRKPAPWFISDAARERLPGNHYALRAGFRKVSEAVYVDQKSSHHSIASTIDLPHPHWLRARGRFRAVEAGESPVWKVSAEQLIHKRHVGLLIATVDCRTIPEKHLHLYPKWAQVRGERQVWVWTPELRLLADRLYDKVKLIHVSAALTSHHADDVISEYAQWSLDRLNESWHPAIKPALLAAYGMLAIRSSAGFDTYTLHGRSKPPRADRVKLPLVDGAVYRSTIERKWTPSVQNVIARGVIESETMTRSLEFARTLESSGIPVLQVYADGLIADTRELPLMPPGWRWAGVLANVSARTSNSIVSTNLVRMPGIPQGRRVAHLDKRSACL